MSFRIQSATPGLALLLCVAGSPAPAQSIPRSQAAVVSQRVANTRLEIAYHRPVARGRPLFGTLVPWGRIWTPSADSAARLTVSAPVTLNGARLEAGSYALWMIPDSLAWTVIVSAKADAFHLRYPEGEDVLRLTAAPSHGEYVETLLFAFPMVDADSATLQMRWGTTVVPILVKAVRP